MKHILTLLLTLSSFLSQAQKLPDYRNLVMEGGGIKGIAYGGAMMELENRGILKKITRVAGTSAGAIQASLLAIGYSVEDISEIISITEVEDFNDGGLLMKGTKRLTKSYGWFKGDNFLSKMEELIGNRTGNPDLTFSQLHDLAKTYPFRDLYIAGSDLSDQKTVVFSHENYPNMRVADAVRVSMSIPLYYRALWLNAEGEIIEKPKPEDDVHLFVDGGILLNYPINVFDHSKYIENYEGIPEEVFNNESIGLRLERMEQIDQELENGTGIAPYEITTFGSYMSALGSILMRNVHPPHPKDINRTIFINDLGISPRVRMVPEDEKNRLMESGKKGVIDFLARMYLITD